MNDRITSNESKVGIVIGGWVIGLLAALGVGAVVGGLAGTDAGVVTGMVLLYLTPIVIVVFCVRTFRGPSEPVAPPRRWWRMTERPTSGFIVGGLFLVQTFTAITTVVDRGPLLSLLATMPNAIAAVAFLGSAIKLVRSGSAASAATSSAR